MASVSKGILCLALSVPLLAGCKTLPQRGQPAGAGTKVEATSPADMANRPGHPSGEPVTVAAHLPLGQAAHEQFAADPDSIRSTPYYFGRQSSSGPRETSLPAKRC